MSDMFCFQCQQTAGGSDCVRTGVCGKQPETAHLQDRLVCRLIRLAQTCESLGQRPDEVTRLLTDGLFSTLTNVNVSNEAIRAFLRRVNGALEQRGVSPEEEDPSWLWKGETDIVSLRSTLLFGMKGMAAYAHHAFALGYHDDAVSAWFYKGLSALTQEHTVEEWLSLILEFGQVNFQCMALLDWANTGAFGAPAPTRVNTDIKKGPFIVVSGHDLEDLHQLLEQTAGKGINIYTHCEMLPAHGYPRLKEYPHLAGNFGTAWQSQQKEFEDIPAPILFTTNCLMPPRPSYADRVYTTSVVGYEGLRHIHADEHGRKDFSPLVQQSLALGGYSTEFVKRTPMNSLVLTLACGKFRFNDLDLGEIAGIPRILDVGQCNDAYSAVQIALALAEAFGCSVNELPLTLVLSWYEQKAVCILLSLLALGVKNIYLGPTLPAFLSESVVKTLVDTFGLQPTTAPQQDLDSILHRG